MNKEKILGFAIGPIVTSTLGFITVPVTTWIFNAEDVGRMNIFQIVSSFFIILSVLGLDQAYVREYHEAKDKQQLLLATYLPGFLLLALIGMPSFYYSNEISLFLYEINDPKLYWMTLSSFFILYMSRFLSLVLRLQERGWAYSISQILPKLMQIVFLLSLANAAFEKQFMHFQFISVASMLIVLILYGWYTRVEWTAALKKKVDFKQITDLLKFGTPLIFSGLAFWGLTAISTIALRYLTTLEELAIYSVASSFSTIGIVFQSIFTTVWAPTVYKWVSKGVDMSILDKITMQAFAVVSAIICVTASFTWILDWFLPDHYHSVKYLILCMLIQPLFYTLSEITCVGIAISRKTIYTIGVVTVALLVNCAMSYWLIPLHGAAGASVANALAFMVFFWARTEVSSRLWRNIEKIKIYILSSLILALAIFSTLLGDKFPIVYVAVVASFSVFCIYFFRSQWVEILEYIKRNKI